MDTFEPLLLELIERIRDDARRRGYRFGRNPEDNAEVIVYPDGTVAVMISDRVIDGIRMVTVMTVTLPRN